MKSKIGIIALLLSALVFHDFFKIEAFKLGPLTLTYQRIVIMALAPIILLPKFKINIRDRFLTIILIFSMYGLLRICGNYREFLVIYFPLITFILLYILTKKEKEIRFCINFFATTLIFFCFIGLIEIFTGYHFVESYLKETKTKWLAVGMYFNENDFAAFLTTLIFYMLLSNYSLFIKIVTIMVSVYIIYMNGCQICLLALLTYVLLYFVFRVFRIENKKTRLFLLIFSLIPILIMKRLFVQIILHSSLFARTVMYSIGIKVCKNNLLFGTGIGNYESAAKSLGLNISSSISANPHNLLLELAGQFGIIWIFFLIILLIKLFLYIYKSNYKHKILLFGLLYIYPFISIASSSALGKNYTYLALFIPLLLYRDYKYKVIKYD